MNQVFEEEYTDEEFAETKKSILERDNVQIRDKEQLLYYESFRKIFGKPSEVFTDKGDGAKLCPQCKGYVKTRINFCRICGAYPI